MHGELTQAQRAHALCTDYFMRANRLHSGPSGSILSYIIYPRVAESTESRHEFAARARRASPILFF